MYELRFPSATLAPYVENFWFVSSTAASPVDLKVDVFVDARADLVFNFGAPYTREVIGGSVEEVSRSTFDAQRLVPIRIVQRGAVEVAGVRFRLGGAGAFVRAPLAQWTGATPDPAEVFGGAASALQTALRVATSTDEKAALFDAFLVAALHGDPSYASFARALEAVQGRATNVGEVAAAAGVSARQVERLFARFLGVSPRAALRVVRFQRALGALMRDPGVSLAEVGAGAGYFDQAHFIRDFRKMTGGVPRGYRGYFPVEGPSDFAPNVVVFVQDAARRHA